MLFTIIGLIVIAIVIYWLIKENQKCKAEKAGKVEKVEKVEKAEEVKQTTQVDTLMKVDKFAVVGSCSQNSCSIRRH